MELKHVNLGEFPTYQRWVEANYPTLPPVPTKQDWFNEGRWRTDPDLREDLIDPHVD